MESVEEVVKQTESKSSNVEKEVLLKNGEVINLPTIHVDKMRLYHGSPKKDITAFREGDQQTIGRGIYFTPNVEAAQSYARKRSNEEATSTLYEVEVYDLDMADLRTRSAQEQFARLFRQSLLDWEQNVLPNLKGPSEEILRIIKEQRKEAVEDLVHKIDGNSFNHLRDLTFGWADLVSTTLSDAGYKGLISIEGEPPLIDFHDSVVIFNPSDVSIVGKKEVA